MMPYRPGPVAMREPDSRLNVGMGGAAKKEENKQAPAPPVSEPPKQAEKKQVSFGNLGKKEEPAKPAEQKPGIFGAGLNKAADQSQP